MTATHQQFCARLARFSRRRRHLLNAALAYGQAARALAVGAAVLVFGAGWLGNVFVNAALFLAAAGALVWFAGRALWRRTRFPGYLAEAFHLEAVAGGLDSRLVAALDFLARGRDTELARAVIARAEQDLAQPCEARLDVRPRNRARAWCLAGLVLFVALGCTPWFGFARVAANGRACVVGLREYLFPTRWELTPAPGQHIRRLGEEQEVVLRFTQHGHPAATLVWQSAGATSAQRDLLPADADGAVRRVFRSDSEATYRLHFAFGRRQTPTPELTLVFTARPVLENMQTELVSPAYTRLVPRDLEGVQTRLTGLPGTRITIGFTFSKELRSAQVTWDDGEKLPLEVVGRFASLSLVHQVARRGVLQVVDLHQLDLETPHPLDFEVLADEPPHLLVPRQLKAEMPSLAEGLRAFSVGVRAWDDFGVARCVLKWRKSTLERRTAVVAEGELERLIVPPLPKVLAEFKTPFASLEVKPGDLISFEFVVDDNRAPNPQRVASPTYAFFIHQEELESQALAADLAFGGLMLGGGRIARAKISNEVGPTQELRTIESFRNEFDAKVDSLSRRPAVRGDFGTAVDRYFKALSAARFKDGGGE